MRIKKSLLACLIGLLLWIPNIHAAQDLKGSRDHPLVGRFAGSNIHVYGSKSFDQYELGLGGVAREGSNYKWTKSDKLEGKVTRITYVAPREATPLAIVRSYEEALKKAGFEVIYASDSEKDLYYFVSWYDQASPDPNQDATRNRRVLLGEKSPRYLAARLRRAEGDVYVAIYANAGGRVLIDFPKVQVDVVELRPLEGGLIAVVTADKMAEGLEKTGRIAIYTIYFDTGKAELKSESEASLKEIAKLIQQNRNLKLYVVGHTDNVGELPYNVDLSQRRAQGVVQALVSRQGIDAKRLHSAGVGPLAPVSPNKTDEGRAKNRRVELVAQ